MKNAAYLYKFRLKTEQNVNLVQDNWVVVQLPALPAIPPHGSQRKSSSQTFLKERGETSCNCNELYCFLRVSDFELRKVHGFALS